MARTPEKLIPAGPTKKPAVAPAVPVKGPKASPKASAPVAKPAPATAAPTKSAKAAPAPAAPTKPAKAAAVEPSKPAKAAAVAPSKPAKTAAVATVAPVAASKPVKAAKPEKPAPVAASKPVKAAKPAPVAPAPVAPVAASKPTKAAKPAPAAPAAAAPVVPAPVVERARAEAPERPRSPAPSGTCDVASANFVRGLFDRMGLRAQVAARDHGEGQVEVAIQGADGLGRNRDLVAAVGLVSSLAAGRGRPERVRVRLDFGEAPRAEQGTRESLLTGLAADIAGFVLRTGRRAVVERLSSSERRVVHTALSDEARVSTHSEGGEQNRYLLVSKAR